MPMKRAGAAFGQKLQQTKDASQADMSATKLRDQLRPATVPPASANSRGAVKLSDANPEANGVADPGTSPDAARADHVHPSTGGLSDQGIATFLDFANASAPPAPAGGYTRIYTKPDKSFYQKDEDGTETGLGSPGGGGGNATDTGAIGSEPGSPATGDLYFPDNSFVVERFDGSVWAPWGPIFPLTAPPTSGWSWTNQGGASVDTTKGGIYLTAPPVTSYSHRIRKRAAPSTPYVITAMIIPRTNPLALANAFAVLWRESSSGKLAGPWFEMAGSYRYVYFSTKWNSETSYNSSYNTFDVYERPVFIRIADDGTDRITSWSYDGQHFAEIQRVGRTDFLTADQVCFVVNSGNTTYDMAAQLVSWDEA